MCYIANGTIMINNPLRCHFVNHCAILCFHFLLNFCHSLNGHVYSDSATRSDSEVSQFTRMTEVLVSTGHPSRYSEVDHEDEMDLEKGIRLLERLKQQVSSSPDYITIGRGWNYPETRKGYRSYMSNDRQQHPSIRNSASRQRKSADHISKLISVLKSHRQDRKHIEQSKIVAIIGEAILREAGIGDDNSKYHRKLRDLRWSAVSLLSFIEAEAIHMFRAFNELVLASNNHSGDLVYQSKHEKRAEHTVTTMNGELIPEDLLNSAVSSVLASMIKGDFPQNRFDIQPNDCSTSICEESGDDIFNNALRRNNTLKQLNALNDKIDEWRKQFSVEIRFSSSDHLTVIASEEEGYDIIWATKIGGPSHGFDFESQCVLPLLLNGRHKALILSIREDAATTIPIGRCHIRILEMNDDDHQGWKQRIPDNSIPHQNLAQNRISKMIMYIEPLNIDFDANIQDSKLYELQEAVVIFSINRAINININIISFSKGMYPVISRVLKNIKKYKTEGLPMSISTNDYAFHIDSIREAEYLLHPSNAIVEASDTLSDRHDWVQISAEVVKVYGRVHLILLPNGDNDSAYA